MCGIFGIAAVVGCRPSLDDRGVLRARDMMVHRGPDGCGVWRHENVVFAHRRLAVIDPTDAGQQPMGLGGEGSGACGSPQATRRGELGGLKDKDLARFAIVYNGELYNDAELRAELRSLGVTFSTRCDTETVLRAFAAWGTGAFARMRGMFALALYDTKLRLLTLARDALGVKPLFFRVGAREVMFASEAAVLARCGARAAPNMRMVSAYLTTIRTTLGSETLFEGVHALRPGQMMQCDVGSADRAPVIRLVNWWRGARVNHSDIEPEDAARRVRAAVEDSVQRQMRSDVPMCTLLSGGLDSTIITATARREKHDLRTFCAGAPLPRECGSERDTDLSCARRAAELLGTVHGEALVTREVFNERWPWMVAKLGVPLTTPNEVAIFALSERLRAEGCVVTLSGEGADELFAGYDQPLDAALRFIEEQRSGAALMSAGGFELRSQAWVAPDFKRGVLSERAWEAADEDRWLSRFYDEEFTAAAGECGEEGLAAHLRLQRRINLSGLLQRLDTATMLAGVEGRTPFADAEVAMLAESLPMALKFAESGYDEAESSGALVMSARRTASRTKMVLREAFTDAVPAFVRERAKASFPLPFQDWVVDHVNVLRDSSFAAEVFSGAAIWAVVEKPRELWRLAWPMVNLAYWARG